MLITFPTCKWTESRLRESDVSDTGSGLKIQRSTSSASIGKS